MDYNKTITRKGWSYFMVYELTLTATQIKTTIFDPPARLINYKELSCAVGMAYKQAGLVLPQVENGKDIKAFRNESLQAFGNNPDVNEKVKYVIENYIFSPGEVMDEDSQVTMKLGYEAG